MCASYACFLILFLRFRGATTTGTDGRATIPLFTVITLLSAILGLATVCLRALLLNSIKQSLNFFCEQIAISVSIERDWVTTIAQGNSEQLTMLNTFVSPCVLIIWKFLIS